MKHVEEAGETYWQHAKFAFGLARSLMGMGWVMAMHGLFPEWKRFDDRIGPFTDDLKKTITTRQLQLVHRSLVRKAVEEERAVRSKEDNAPTNGKLDKGSNGGF